MALTYLRKNTVIASDSAAIHFKTVQGLEYLATTNTLPKWIASLKNARNDGLRA